jgi:hypothetical protein
MRHCLIFFLAVCAVLPAKALETENLQVSLLTVMPRPNKVYTIYGHTALRLYDPVQHVNAVFNWGTFDFRASYFLYRFIKGETDYFLSVTDYESFLYAYSYDNAAVIEQILNITPEGKEALLQILSLNLQPENLVYRYNFLFDNCTTRIRDIIEKCSTDPLVYPEQTEKVTFRELIHSCTAPYPWMTFGIDLLIGNGADSLIQARQELFLPEKLMLAFDKIAIVSETEQVLKTVNEPVVKLKFWDSPMIIGFLLFTGYVLIAVWGRLKKRRFKGFFAPLFLVAGAAGCLVCFTTLFSEHPCTSPNWNLLWLHPFHLIAFAGYFRRLRVKSATTKLIVGYHTVNLILLSVLLIGWHWIPQTLNPADIPYILCLGLASFFYITKN